MKYRDLGPGGGLTLPAAAVKHYSAESAIVQLTQVGRIIPWDNRNTRLTADETE
jgi:hypothetical protein